MHQNYRIISTHAWYMIWLYSCLLSHMTLNPAAVSYISLIQVETIFGSSSQERILFCSFLQINTRKEYKRQRSNDIPLKEQNIIIQMISKIRVACCCLPHRFLWCSPACGQCLWMRVSECTAPANSLAWHEVCEVYKYKSFIMFCTNWKQISYKWLKVLM